MEKKNQTWAKAVMCSSDIAIDSNIPMLPYEHHTVGAQLSTEEDMIDNYSQTICPGQRWFIIIFFLSKIGLRYCTALSEKEIKIATTFFEFAEWSREEIRKGCIDKWETELINSVGT